MYPAGSAVQQVHASAFRTCFIIVCVCAIIQPRVSADPATCSSEASGNEDSFSRPFVTLSNDAIETFFSTNNLSASISDLRYVRFIHEHERFLRGLVVPLLLDQRTMLLFFRYHALTSIEINGFIDDFVDPIDQAPLASFLFYFCVCPSWPMYKAQNPPPRQSNIINLQPAFTHSQLYPAPPHLLTSSLPGFSFLPNRLHRR
jgi:hypothetical protein